ncbi:calpastatin [Bifidobacterium italicum]|uniref:Calpastatin n=1 Tax=Bifidobacterium italicum TaxID=1960968 RepID=A0A2A2EFW8_9BIFI|nr:DUF1810 domain-containing protein [Bifidobacterium italicum]PAU67842.1 calpastatin [Bifidobacterium italicum]
MTKRHSAYDLTRFVQAQESGIGFGVGSYDMALREICAGRKSSHWIWYIFSQLGGLGKSEMSRRYALHGADEARAFLDHPVLGAHLREITQALLLVEERNPVIVMGSAIDARKLCSSMTLFAQVAEDETLFADVLDAYFDGRRDRRTLAMLRSRG